MSTNVAVADTTAPTRRCKRPAGPLTRKQRSPAHRIKMQIRRARQHQRTPSFTPVVNNRLSGAVQAEFAALMIANADKIPTGAVTIENLQNKAIRAVAAALPPERQVFDWRNGLPTKNSDPAYRMEGSGGRPRRFLDVSAKVAKNSEFGRLGA